MAKPKLSAASFLRNLELQEAKADTTANAASESDASAEKVKAAKVGTASRAGLKHIGGYFNRETTEQVAILRARLGLDNSQLLKRAIEELYSRETAARKFGDR